MEPLEDRRFLTTTTLLNDQTIVETANTTHTWSAPASLPHTHEVFAWSGGAYPGRYSANPPAGGTKVDISFNGEVVYHKSWSWVQSYPGAGYYAPVVDSEWWSPDVTGDNSSAQIKFDGDQAEFKVSSSGFDPNHAFGANVQINAVNIAAITPEVSVTSSFDSGGVGTASEGDPANPGKFIFLRYGAPVDVPLTVNYQMSGTATPGLDYSTPGSAGTVVFDVDSVRGHLAGEAGDGVFLTAIPDGLTEPDETAIASVVAGANYFPAGTPATVGLRAGTVTAKPLNISVSTGVTTGTTHITTDPGIKNEYEIVPGTFGGTNPAGVPAPVNGLFVITGQKTTTQRGMDVTFKWTGGARAAGATWTYTFDVKDKATGDVGTVTITIN